MIAPPAHDELPPIDVAIVVYHPKLEEIEATLRALAQACEHGLRTRLNLWFNDGGPERTPGLAEVLERARRAGQAVRIEGSGGPNLGFGRAVNALLPNLEADFVLLLNQDAVPEPGALVDVSRAATRDEPDVAAWEMRQVPYEHPKDYDPVTREATWCSAAALLLRTRALRQIGGFEPRFFMYCEDVDLSWRLRCAGHRLRYRPDCAVVHRTYSRPGETKPLAVLGGCYANLCLRARFAGLPQVVEGVRMLLRELRGPQAFTGRRQGLVRGLLRFARNFAYFRRTRAAGHGFIPHLAGWDYEQRRDDPFHPFLSAAERYADPLPAVLAIVRRQPSGAAATGCLQTVLAQTHRHVHVMEVSPDVPASAVHCPPGVEWILELDPRDHLYADHVEVLLQAARTAQAEAAVGVLWVIDADPADARAAHRRHAARRSVWSPPHDRPAALWRRDAWARADRSTAKVLEVPRTTIVRYERVKAPAPDR